MFTGLVEGMGTVTAIEDREGARSFVISAGAIAADLAPGDSIAVSGVCLTATSVEGDTFACDVLLETIDRTSFDRLQPGDRVNLERPLLPSDRLGGHFVQGHVDGVADIERVEREGPDWRITVGLPIGLRRYAVEKGSISLDGVSMTIAGIEGDGAKIEVALIPETVSRTTLGAKRPGDLVHVEVDILAKYVERLLPVLNRQEQGK